MHPDQYTLKLIDLPRTDPRLGRRVHHDSRSLQYLVPEMASSDLRSVAYTSVIPVLDQGNLGSCTGNAATKALSYGAVLAALAAMQTFPLDADDPNVDEEYAVGVYSAATKIDPFSGYYPPQDTGSDGLSVAKVLKSRGLISGYRHATSLTAVLTALQTSPGITGIGWTENMFDPTSAGEIVPTGPDAGGHELVVDEVDLERLRVWVHNSWTARWGINGRAWMSFDAYENRLMDNGDFTELVPATAPAPVPGPPPDSSDTQHARVLAAWLDRNPWFYKDVQADSRRWLAKQV